MHYITERAVFELRREGLVLTEVAEGIDLSEGRIGIRWSLPPIIAKDLKIIPTDIYNDGPFGLDKWL